MKAFSSTFLFILLFFVYARAQSCRVHVDFPLTNSQLKNALLKNLKLVSHDTFLATTIAEAEYGFKMEQTARGLEGYLYWTSNQEPYKGKTFAYNPQDYLKNRSFEGVSKTNFVEKFPTCKELKSIEDDLHYGMIMRTNSAKSKSALVNGEASKFNWGLTLLDIEATLTTKADLQRRQSQLNLSATKYKKLLSLKESLHENKGILDKVDWLRKRLIKDFGLSSNNSWFFNCNENSFLTNLLQKKPCGNDVAKTLLVISALKDLGIKSTQKYQIGVQHFWDHLRPVIYLEDSQQLLDLVTGEFDKKFSGVVYRPEFVFWGYERYLYESGNQYRHWYLYSYDYRRQLILEIPLWHAPINAFRDAMDFFNFDKQQVYRWGTADWFFFDLNLPGFLKGDGDQLKAPKKPGNNESQVSPPSANGAEPATQTGGGLNENRAKAQKSDPKEELKSRGWQVKSESKGQLITWDEMLKYFDSADLQSLAAAHKISDLKDHFDLVEIKNGKLTAYGIEIQCTAIHRNRVQTKTIGAKLTDTKENLDLIFLTAIMPKNAACIGAKELTNHKQYLYLLKTYDRLLKEELDSTDHFKKVLAYLQTGDFREISDIDNISPYNSSSVFNFMMVLNAAIKKLPRYPSVNPEYPIREEFEKTFTRHGLIPISIAKPLLSALNQHYSRFTDHNLFIDKMNRASSEEKANYFSVIDKLTVSLSDYEEQLIDSSAQDQLIGFTDHYISKNFVANTENIKSLFRPLRKVLVNLLNDPEVIYMPKLSSEERQALANTLEQLKTEYLKSKIQEQGDANTKSRTNSEAFEKSLSQRVIMQIPLSRSQSASLPLWEKSVDEIDPSIYQGLHGVMGFDDRKSGDFAFPLLFRWAKSLLEDSSGLYRKGITPIALLWKVDFTYMTIGPDSDLKQLKIRRGQGGESLPVFRRSLIDHNHIAQTYKYYQLRPGLFLHYKNNGNIKSQGRRILYDMFMSYQKFPVEISDFVQSSCEEVNQMVYGGEGSCRIENQPTESVSLKTENLQNKGFQIWLKSLYSNSKSAMNSTYFVSSDFAEGNSTLVMSESPH